MGKTEHHEDDAAIDFVAIMDWTARIAGCLLGVFALTCIVLSLGVS